MPCQAGLDVLDAEGAGAGLLAAAVGDCDGGASVGDGFGAADVPCGCEFEVPALGAAAADEWALRPWRPALLADADGEGLPDDDADAVGLVPTGDLFPVVAPAT